MQAVETNKTAFDRAYDPISSSGMLRHAVDFESILNDILNGEATDGEPAFDKLLLSDQTELTISSGAVSAPTLAFHTIKAQSGTTDDLDTIGVSNNTFLFLKAKAGHTIAIRNGTGNVSSGTGVDMGLTGNRVAMLFCVANQWSLIGMNRPIVNYAATTDPGSGDDALDGYSVGSLWINTTLDRAWECVDPNSGSAIWKPIHAWKNGFWIRAAGDITTPYQGWGITGTTAGAKSVVIDSDGTWMQHDTGTTSGQRSEMTCVSTNLLRPGYSPVIEFLIKTPSDLTSHRWWIGCLSTGGVIVDGAGDTASSEFIGWRQSTGGGDTGWVPILRDTTTQTAGTSIGTISANTVYKLRIRVDANLTTAYFSVNDGAEQALSTNFPPIATELGCFASVITQTNALRSLLVGRLEVGW